MKEFLGKDFLLDSELATELYVKYAKDMPIFDFHCHISPKEIYENKPFENITQAWLVKNYFGDHYKWRCMRAYGVSEDYLTGSKPDFEKFMKWAEVVPYLIGNPLYHWTHMELSFFFDIHEPLSTKNAIQVYEQTNQQLLTLTPRKMIEKSNVKVICTTDEPVDDLKWHKLLADDQSFKTKVIPAFRSDKIINIDRSWFNQFVDEMLKISDVQQNTLEGFECAISKRIEYFYNHGCLASDQGIDELVYEKATKEEVTEIFMKARHNIPLNKKEIAQYKGYILIFLGREYNKYHWVQQYHIGALRDNSSRMLQEIGPNTGYDAINDQNFAPQLAQILDNLDGTDELPRTILYCLNSKDQEVLATIGGCFQKDIFGKIQLGAAWWFQDQKFGILKQMNTLANMGLLSAFVGMLTDSRSFLSYPRHDYFRRILCSYLAKLIENGDYPNDIEFVGSIIQNICYNNAINYFGVNK